MFSTFFYTCKEKGLNVTLSEWLTLQEALDKGLCNSSLTEFYYLARMILVKSETDFDKFDMAFEETFKGIQSENEISKNMMKWLDKSELIDMVDEEERYRMNEQDGIQFIDKDEVEAKFKERLRDQDSEHNGGSFWIGSIILTDLDYHVIQIVHGRQTSLTFPAVLRDVPLFPKTFL